MAQVHYSATTSAGYNHGTPIGNGGEQVLASSSQSNRLISVDWLEVSLLFLSTLNLMLY